MCTYTIILTPDAEYALQPVVNYARALAEHERDDNYIDNETYTDDAIIITYVSTRNIDHILDNIPDVLSYTYE